MLKTAKLLLFWVAVAKARPACKPESFQADSPKHFGLEVVKITAEEVLKWNEWTTSVPATPGLPSEPKEIDFCDVKVYYTHPGTTPLASPVRNSLKTDIEHFEQG